MLFLGLPFITFGIIFLELNDKKEKILMKSINLFTDGKELDEMIQYYLKLVDHKYLIREEEVILKGYVTSHEKNCLFIDCPLTNVKKIMDTYNNHNGSDNFYSNAMIHSELILYINKVYIFGLNKFNSCTTLMISYAIFLIQFLKQKAKAKAMLENAEKDNPPFNEQFIIFRYKKHINEEQDIFNNNGDSDVVSGIAYESHFRQCKTNILNTAKNFFDFWEILGENSENTHISKLNNIGHKINQGLQDINTHW